MTTVKPEPSSDGLYHIATIPLSLSIEKFNALMTAGTTGQWLP